MRVGAAASGDPSLEMVSCVDFKSFLDFRSFMEEPSLEPIGSIHEMRERWMRAAYKFGKSVLNANRSSISGREGLAVRAVLEAGCLVLRLF
jgi:hypothetical protein